MVDVGFIYRILERDEIRKILVLEPQRHRHTVEVLPQRVEAYTSMLQRHILLYFKGTYFYVLESHASMFLRRTPLLLHAVPLYCKMVEIVHFDENWIGIRC